MFYNVKDNGQGSLTKFTNLIYGENVSVINICKKEIGINFLE